MNIQLIQIEQLKQAHIFKPAPSPDYQYTGLAIEYAGAHYYWAKGVSVKISAQDYRRIKSNPKLYYFSTALKLHCQIEQALQSAQNAT